MFVGFINTKISKKILVTLIATFLYYLTNLSLFGGKMYPPYNEGGGPAMINQNNLFYIFVTTNKASNKI